MNRSKNVYCYAFLIYINIIFVLKNSQLSINFINL